jgi:PKD repeat protein
MSSSFHRKANMSKPGGRRWHRSLPLSLELLESREVPSTVPGLVAAYSFDEGRGSTLFDSSGNGNNGIISNATWSAAGKYGGSLYFNGTNALVRVPGSASLYLTKGMTLEAWVMPTALTGSRDILFKEQPWGLSYGLYAAEATPNPGIRRWSPTNAMGPNAQVTTPYGADQAAQTSLKLPLNTWSFVAATYDGSSLRLYVNGNLVGTTSVAGSIIETNGTLDIGGNSLWGQYFQGLIDNVRIYNQALGLSAIRADMFTPVSGTSTTPVGNAGPAQAANEGSPITFAGSATGGSGALSYSWNFGDGTAAVTGTLAPTHTYMDGGKYTVTLTVTDSLGKTNVSSTTATVSDMPPTANAGGPYSGLTNSMIAFAGTGSSVDPTDTLTYSWSFGDGTTASGQNVDHAFASAGTYTVILTVSDSEGAHTSVTATATVTGGPTGSAGPAQAGQEGSLFSFVGTASGGLGALGFSWNFGDGTSPVTGTLTPTHVYAVDGQYTVTLTVTDSLGRTGTYTTGATVTNVAPTVSAGGPYAGTTGVAVAFSGTGSVPDATDVLTYTWSFGDGTTATGQNVSHVYATGGTFTVDLTVSDGDGGTTSASTTATVVSPPVANAGPAQSGSEGTSVTFAGTATGGTGALSYSWNFGDGTADVTGTLTPSHTYVSAGQYTVSLTVTDSTGVTDQASTTATVTDVAATVNAGGPYSGTTGVAVAFAGSATSPDPTDTLRYVWHFGDGSTAFGRNVSHVYATAGNYTVTLTVSDQEGARSSVTTTASIGSSTPVANAGSAQSGPEGSSFAFTGTGTGGTGALSYSWNFGDGTAAVTGTLTPTHTYVTEGQYIVTLTVTDTVGATSQASTTATVNDVAPTVNVGGPYSGTTGSAVAFAGSGTVTDPTDTLTYTWSFGDGGTATGQTASHVYATAGTYNVTLTVSDQEGATSTATTTATASDPSSSPPVADAGSAQSGPEGSSFAFTGTASGGSGALSYSWNFGDGTAAVTGTLNPTHTYLIEGQYAVTLTVTDSVGATGQASTTATVSDVAPTVNTGGPYSGTAGTAIAFVGSATVPDPTDTLTYSWNFGDGSTATGQNASHVFATAGTYNVTLTVSDPAGGTTTTAATTATASDTSSSPPVANAGPAQSGSEGSAIAFAGSATGGTGALTYSWNFGDGTAAVTGTLTPTHTYLTEGRYTATLTVTDSTGASSQSSTIATVADTAPTAITGGPYTGAPGTAIAFSGNASVPDPTDTLTYHWNFGDGTTATGRNVGHTYTTINTYTVTLTVTDQEGHSGTATTTATVLSSAVPNEPLLYHSNVQYVGSFRLPNYYTGVDQMSFGGSVLAYNPANNSLFITGMSQGIAEVSIPNTLVNSGSLSALATASILQPWTNVLGQLPNPIAGATDGTDIGGLVVYNGHLVGTAYAYYSGANTQTTSHFVVDSLNLSSAGVQGMYQVGGSARLVSGYMTAIPAEWQGALGAPYLTGGADVPIISTTSSGPAAFGFDPSGLGSGAIPATPYMYYTTDNPLGPYYGAADPLQSGVTTVNGAVFVPGTSSVLFIGRSGANFSGYGFASDYGDTHDGALDGKGPHNLNGDYVLQVWAYNANDFVAVKQGSLQPWQVQPYDVWNFTLPIPAYQVGGVAFDPNTGRIYVALPNLDQQAYGSSLPLIAVFQVNLNAPASTHPEIGTLAGTPTTLVPGPVAAGTTVTLTAGNVYAVVPGASVTQVAFYIEPSGSSSQQLLGYGTPSTIPNAGHNWTLDISTTGLASGNYTIVAVALDSNGLFSDPITYTLTIA